MASFAKKVDKSIMVRLEQLDMSDVMYMGFSMKMDQWVFASIIAQKIKSLYPDIPILAGGISNRRIAKLFLENFTQFDVAMWGEGEYTIAEITRAIESGFPLDNVGNIAYRNDGRVVFSNSPKRKYLNLSEEELYPDYSDFFEQRSSFKINHEIVIPIEGSRGCHWNKCRFCYLNADYLYRLKSIEKIGAEILHQIQEYQVYKFEFLDNDLVGKDIRRFDMLLDEFIRIKEIHPDFQIVLAEIITKDLNKGIIEKMSKAGILYAQIGYESPSAGLLKKINKKNTFASNLLYIKYAIQFGIKVKSVNVLFNLLEETGEDIFEGADNLRFLRFSLGKNKFWHALIPLCINSTSRYFKDIDEQKTSWRVSRWTYTLMKDWIRPVDHWDIFDYIKAEKNPQWNTFLSIEQHYLSNKYTYDVTRNTDGLLFEEKMNGVTIAVREFLLFSLETEILIRTNDQVVSLQSLTASLSSEYNEDTIKNSIRKLAHWGLVYHSTNFDAIVSTIDINIPYSIFNHGLL